MTGRLYGVILRERLPDGYNRKTGWVIIGMENEVRERKVLAVLGYELGLELARQITSQIARKFKAQQIIEELEGNQGETTRVVEHLDSGMYRQ